MIPPKISGFFLGNKLTRGLYRKAGKKWRRFKARSRNHKKLSFSSKLSYTFLFFIQSDSRFIKFIVKSSTINRLMKSRNIVATRILKFFVDYGWKTKNRNILTYIAGISYYRCDYQVAFDFYFHLIKKHAPKPAWINRAIASEAKLASDVFFNYFITHQDSFPKEVSHGLICAYSQQHESITPNWNAIFSSLSQSFNIPLANRFLISALAFQKLEYIPLVETQVFSLIKMENNNSEAKEKHRRTLTIIAACYYRSGNISALKFLDSKISFPNLDWQLYMEFGKNDLMEVMNIRGETIKGSFLSHFPTNKNQKKKKPECVIVPEKDICGEAFNALFYKALTKEKQSIKIVCDNRLTITLSENFPEIEFIPKTPRYLHLSEKEKFSKIPPYLCNFLDNDSFRDVKGSCFEPIDYKRYFQDKTCVEGRKNGWLKPNNIIKKNLIDKLKKNREVKLIGIASHSTLRSRLRDIHMINMNQWEEIFSLQNVVFVNLNADLNDEDCLNLSKKYNIELVHPKFDLYNDFSSLIALISILDYAIVPANNLMDFAAAVGVKTIVFSPTNIMKSWRFNSTNEYIFSENVNFIFPENSSENPIKNMVIRCSEKISEDLKLSAKEQS